MFNPSNLNPDDIDQYAWKSMNSRFNPSAQDYLKFAIADLNEGKTQRHLINTISNAKRAMHLRIEDLCLGFGAKDFKKMTRFPQLIDYIRDCGIVAPRILDKINRLRNVVEHEYQVPHLNEVEIFLDVTELFIAATDRWIDRQPCDVEFIGNTKDTSGEYRITSLNFDWKKGEAYLRFGPQSSKRPTDKVTYVSGTDDFFKCVQFTVQNNY